MLQQVKLRIRDEELILETGKLAKQANGSVVARYGGSIVLATVCCSANKIEGLDYIPLSVDYNEKFYAAGKIPGGFLKREARPRDKEIIVSRLIDRPMRPLFSKGFGREIQVIPTTISTDLINTPNILGMIASYAAVHISDIPFNGPVAAIRIARLDGEFITYPTFEQIEKCEMEIIVAGTKKGITMVEGGAAEVSEELMIKAIDYAHPVIIELCNLQDDLRKLAGKPKIEYEEDEEKLEVEEEVRNWILPKLEEACFIKGKHEKKNTIKKIREEALEVFEEKIPEEKVELLKKIFEDTIVSIVRKSILEKNIRTDGRGPDEIRPISCEIDFLPRTHGSALFTRGETQALAVTTVGTTYDEQIMDNIDGDERKHFMLHYNFPPFSVGETRRLMTGRREIGHGHLAERALTYMMPKKEDFPYTIRIVSEVLESNGSSSMATVCGGSMSLLNAGVPLKSPVAGIAMGLIKDSESDNFVVLSDILGEEDHLGDMDFKVTGTEKGITAFQMDIKIESVDSSILTTALEKARLGRMHILSIMNSTIEEPRASISEYAPKIITLKVASDKIGAVIGPGGKNIKRIAEKTEATINIDDDGKTTIFCKNKEGAEKAREMIEAILEEPEIGKVYPGTVKRIMDFGAFVEFLPGKEGLCHISKLANEKVDAVTDVVNEGDEISVRIIEIDRMGRINLSYIDAIEPKGDQEYYKKNADSSQKKRKDFSRDKRSNNYRKKRY